MDFSKSIFIISLIGIFYLAKNVLIAEAVLGGTPVLPNQFKYQVAIEGIKNRTARHTLFGSGAIISNFIVLSTANLFLEVNGQLKDRRFSVVAGSRDLSSPAAFRVDVQSIFFPSFESSFLIYNFAIVQLELGLGIGVNPNVSSIGLPTLQEDYQDTWGVVAGFGYYEALTEIDPYSHLRIVNSGNLSPLLRYGSVWILPDTICHFWFASQYIVTHTCGIMARNSSAELTGVCFGDTGGPLVVGDVLVGIVSHTTLDCDNTEIGALYVRITPFLDKIRNYIYGVIPEGGFMHFNRPYTRRN